MYIIYCKIRSQNICLFTILSFDEVTVSSALENLSTHIFGFVLFVCRIYVYIYVYMNVCMHVCMYESMYMYMYVCMCMYMYVYICMCMYVHIYVRKCISMYEAVYECRVRMFSLFFIAHVRD